MTNDTDATRALIYTFLDAYNAKDPSPFEEHVDPALPWKQKVLEEIRSARAGQVETLDVIVQGQRAAEYWIERGMSGPDGTAEPEIWGVNLYEIANGHVVGFSQIEERRANDDA